MPFTTIFVLYCLFCLQRPIQGKGTQHHDSSHFEGQIESSSSGDRSMVGRNPDMASLVNSNRRIEESEDTGSLMDDREPIGYDDIISDDYYDECDDSEIYNPLCLRNKDGDYDEKLDDRESRNFVDKRRLRTSKRRLRFHKRRLRFVKKSLPHYMSTSSSKLSMINALPRNSRAPRLRFVKRDLNKPDAQRLQLAKSTGNDQTIKHTRKRRSVSDFSQDHSLDKRALSFNNDLQVLTDMVVRQVQDDRRKLRERFLAAGKRAEPKLKVSENGDAVLSQALYTLLKSV